MGDYDAAGRRSYTLSPSPFPKTPNRQLSSVPLTNYHTATDMSSESILEQMIKTEKRFLPDDEGGGAPRSNVKRQKSNASGMICPTTTGSRTLQQSPTGLVFRKRKVSTPALASVNDESVDTKDKTSRLHCKCSFCDNEEAGLTSSSKGNGSSCSPKSKTGTAQKKMNAGTPSLSQSKKLLAFTPAQPVQTASTDETDRQRLAIASPQSNGVPGDTTLQQTPTSSAYRKRKVSLQILTPLNEEVAEAKEKAPRLCNCSDCYNEAAGIPLALKNKHASSSTTPKAANSQKRVNSDSTSSQPSKKQVTFTKSVQKRSPDETQNTNASTTQDARISVSPEAAGKDAATKIKEGLAAAASVVIDKEKYYADKKLKEARLRKILELSENTAKEVAAASIAAAQKSNSIVAASAAISTPSMSTSQQGVGFTFGNKNSESNSPAPAQFGSGSVVNSKESSVSGLFGTGNTQTTMSTTVVSTPIVSSAPVNKVVETGSTEKVMDEKPLTPVLPQFGAETTPASAAESGPFLFGVKSMQSPSSNSQFDSTAKTTSSTAVSSEQSTEKTTTGSSETKVLTEITTAGGCTPSVFARITTTGNSSPNVFSGIITTGSSSPNMFAGVTTTGGSSLSVSTGASSAAAAFSPSILAQPQTTGFTFGVKNSQPAASSIQPVAPTTTSSPAVSAAVLPTSTQASGLFGMKNSEPSCTAITPFQFGKIESKIESSMFAPVKPPETSIFSMSTASPTKTTGLTFGGTKSEPTSSLFRFGAPASTTTTQSGFGGIGSGQSALFANVGSAVPVTSAPSQVPAPGGFAFGVTKSQIPALPQSSDLSTVVTAVSPITSAPTQGSGLFGTKNSGLASPTPFQFGKVGSNTESSSFGGMGTANTTLFNMSPASAASQTPGFTFGATNTKAGSPSPFQFGATTTSNISQSSGLGGTGSGQSTIFGSVGSAPPTSASSQTAGFSFGATTTNATSPPFQFGGSANKSNEPTIFGAAGSSNTSMFTTPAVSAPSQVSGFTFGATNSATPASPFQFSGAATTANAPQPSGFGGTGSVHSTMFNTGGTATGAATSSPAPGFTFGSTTQQQPPSPFQFGAAASSMPQPPGFGVMGSPQSPMFAMGGTTSGVSSATRRTQVRGRRYR